MDLPFYALNSKVFRFMIYIYITLTDPYGNFFGANVKTKKSKIIDLSKEMYTCVQLFIREDRMATILYMIMIFFRPLPWYKVDFAEKHPRVKPRQNGSIWPKCAQMTFVFRGSPSEIETRNNAVEHDKILTRKFTLAWRWNLDIAGTPLQPPLPPRIARLPSDRDDVRLVCWRKTRQVESQTKRGRRSILLKVQLAQLVTVGFHYRKKRLIRWASKICCTPV